MSPTQPHDLFKCAGSACSAWRWIGIRRNDPPGTDYGFDALRTIDAGMLDDGDIAVGRCGLAAA
jgi:hypothetical protein